MRHLAPERGTLHKLFEASLLAKGAFALVEGLAGLGLLLTSNARIHAATDWLTRNELIEDPTDPLFSRIARMSNAFDGSSQHFYAIYLLSHGLVKLIVVLMLARRITVAYPLAMIVFAGFVVYQMHRWSLTGSPMMLALSAFDLLVIWLTWREWRPGRVPAGGV